jgi:hypothetical protein
LSTDWDIGARGKHEGLSEELEKGGADSVEEVAKLHRLGAQLRETHLDRAGGARTALFRAEPDST